MRASSLPLLTKCVGSLILPCDHEKSEKTQLAADWGTMVHLWKETGEIHGARDAAGKPNKRMENALALAIFESGIDRLALWPAGGNHEGSLAVAVDGTGQVSRDDTVRDGWVTGHYDFTWWLLEGADGRGELWIDDLKTGQEYPNPPPGIPGHIYGMEVGQNRFPQRADTEQTRFYALGLSELLAYTGPTHVSVTHWPRLPVVSRHSLPRREWHTYTHGELMAYWGDLERMYQDKLHNERAMLGHEDSLILNPGAHCRFCPAQGCLFKTQ